MIMLPFYIIICIGNYCVRMSSDDLTNGFFVAVFERKSAVGRMLSDDTTKQKVGQPNGVIRNATQPIKYESIRKYKTKNRRYKHYPVTAKLMKM